MSITKDDMAEAMHDWCAAANAKDANRNWEMEAGSVGFGYRSFAWRDQSAAHGGSYVPAMEHFYARLINYRLALEDLQTAVREDVGFAWGVYIEEFQQEGMPPERARVRFSQTMAKDASGWKVLMFHRDIQPFDDDGRYPRILTAR